MAKESIKQLRVILDAVRSKLARSHTYLPSDQQLDELAAQLDAIMA